MPSLARRLAAIAVLLLSVAIVAFVGLRAIGVEIGIGQPGSPTPLPATPTAEPSPSVDQLTAFGQIEDAVGSLRGLPAAEIGPPQVLTRDELAEMLPGLLEPPLDNATLRAMGLLGPDQDIVTLTEELYTAQVLGFYDFEAKRMVVVSDAGLTVTARITYAHEYTHALVDAAFDSSAAFEGVAGQRDRELALLAVEEGDASVAMVLWAIGHLSAGEMQEVTDTPVPDMGGIPPWMVRHLEFPYLSGAEFVGQLYASGGWDAVDAAYGDLPISTEQVLHPAKYAAHEAPVEVQPIDLWSAVGNDWAHASETAMGEAWIATWLEGIGVSAGGASAAAAGWGGDWLTVATGPGGEWALGWRIAWDDPIEATQFEDAYVAIQASLPFSSLVVHVSDRESVVFQASTADLLTTISALVPS